MVGRLKGTKSHRKGLSMIEEYGLEKAERIRAINIKKHTGKKYSHVHAEMDKVSKILLSHHRIYGHSVKFLKKYFDTEDEISAGYKHLIADFMDYILGDVIRVVSKDIKKLNVLPPQFFIVKNGKALWDIKESLIKAILKKHGKGEWDITQEAIKKMVLFFRNFKLNF